MKRVFPLIVILITLSLLGIILIQISWIKNSAIVKKEQFAQNIYEAITNVGNEIIHRKQTMLGDNDMSRLFSQYSSIRTESVIDDAELKELLKRELKRQGIDQQFEYSITQNMGFVTMQSPGFRTEYYSTPYKVPLTNNPIMLEELLVYIIEPQEYLVKSMTWMVMASLLFTGVIIAAFALTVRTLFSQKKLSEMKSDFINNMTHEFKTPLATISLAVDALNNQRVISDTDKIKYYSGIIKDENRRMNKQVEKILQAAQLEKKELKLNLQKLNVHEVIEKVVGNAALQLQEKEAVVHLDLKATSTLTFADEVHFANLINNLLDNALKYSDARPEVTISTQNLGKHIYIKVADNGIGMSKETQHRIFEKFYRAHTGNLHNVKGFGLGLSYVKAIVDAHGGKVSVDSTLGKGSTFTVEFVTA